MPTKLEKLNANNHLGLALLLAATVVGCSKQPLPATIQQSATPAFAALTGRVFAITNGGDLKPARIADIYLFDDKQEVSRELRISEAALEREAEGYKSRGANYESHGLSAVARNEFDSCVQMIEIDKSDLHKAFEKARGTDGGGMLGPFETQTDEEGNFQVSKIPQGSYLILAVGQAGANLAVWNDTLALTSGQTATVKLSSPEISCSTLY